jgi:hypothetical protein
MFLSWIYETTSILALPLFHHLLLQEWLTYM